MWTCDDGETCVAVDVDDNEMVMASYPLLRKMLMDLGFAPVAEGEPR